MSAENVFDGFLKDRLGFLKGNYDRFEFSDLKPAIEHAEKLGFFDWDESEESFTLLCSLLKKSSAFDGGFTMVVFIQAAVQRIFHSAGFTRKGLFAYPPFQNFSHDLNLKVTSKDGNHFIEGTAKAVALARETSQVLLAANHANGAASFFLLDLSLCKNVERVPVLGMRTLPLYDLKLEKVQASLIGMEGSGLKHFSDMALPLRVAASAMMFGLLEVAYREARTYGHERVQGGRKIIEWSEHQMMLGQILARVKVSENLLEYCIGKGQKLTESDSLSTLIHFQESLAEMTSTSMQAMGGAGYMKDYPLERFYRDGHQLRCLFGTAPFHKLDLFSREGMNV